MNWIRCGILDLELFGRKKGRDLCSSNGTTTRYGLFSIECFGDFAMKIIFNDLLNDWDTPRSTNHLNTEYRLDSDGFSIFVKLLLTLVCTIKTCLHGRYELRKHIREERLKLVAFHRNLNVNIFCNVFKKQLSIWIGREGFFNTLRCHFKTLGLAGIFFDVDRVLFENLCSNPIRQSMIKFTTTKHTIRGRGKHTHAIRTKLSNGTSAC
mmetsp:Transcript_8010/g.12173  ORF Transcript_8010/g.12173 Transcript_8010/m.12173 type:complete len:209 (-) Transcript_8010:619-1245(-)